MIKIIKIKLSNDEKEIIFLKNKDEKKINFKKIVQFNIYEKDDTKSLDEVYDFIIEHIKNIQIEKDWRENEGTPSKTALAIFESINKEIISIRENISNLENSNEY